MAYHHPLSRELFGVWVDAKNRANEALSTELWVEIHERLDNALYTRLWHPIRFRVSTYIKIRISRQ